MTVEAKNILLPLVRELEEKGLTIERSYFDLTKPDGDDFKALQNALSQATEDEIHKAIQEAKTNEYLVYYSIAGGREKFRMTTKGFYAGKALLQNEKKKASRTRMKALSDWINEHNGLTTAYASIVATIALFAALLGLYLRWQPN